MATDYFEITLILDKKQAAAENAYKKLLSLLEMVKTDNDYDPEYECEKRNFVEHKYDFFRNQEVIANRFDYDDVDFSELCISFTGLIVKKENLEETIKYISPLISDCFKSIDSICFIIGMYEGTYHYFQNLKNLSEFDNELLSKFPLLFFGKENCSFKTFMRFDNFICVYNDYNPQDIFIIEC